MPLLAALLLLSLTGCQVYVGGATLASDGRSATISSREATLGSEGVATRTTRTTIERR